MPGYQWLDFMLTEQLGKKELPNVFFYLGPLQLQLYLVTPQLARNVHIATWPRLITWKYTQQAELYK